jgi:sulfatase maturation enzyme AslB (radical SAM superfamily)
MLSNGLEVPSTDIDWFLDMEYPLDMNREFISKNFHRPPGDCLECQYYNLCMAGCPFFRSKNGGVDPYCDVYKKIFQYLKEMKENNCYR